MTLVFLINNVKVPQHTVLNSNRMQDEYVAQMIREEIRNVKAPAHSPDLNFIQFFNLDLKKYSQFVGT